MAEKTLGKELIDAIEEALSDKEAGRIVRPFVDVSELRKSLKLSQAQFSKKYHINIETIRNWEQHKRSLDTTALAYLTCIAKQPKLISNLLNLD